VPLLYPPALSLWERVVRVVGPGEGEKVAQTCSSRSAACAACQMFLCMKNQYFGDINDFRKYGLLRTLCGNDLSLAVCWMLTEDDGGQDGGKRRYLKEERYWCKFDETLFASLKQTSDRDKQNVCYAEKWGILSTAQFYFSDSVPTDTGERQRYFERFFLKSRKTKFDLIFFDPDNGWEVPSAPYRAKRSVKHVYSDELWSTFSRGHSVLFYQHFARPREGRDAFVTNTEKQLIWLTGAGEVYSFRTTNVAFFLIPRVSHRERFRSRASELSAIWEDQFLTT